MHISLLYVIIMLLLLLLNYTITIPYCTVLYCTRKWIVRPYNNVLYSYSMCVLYSERSWLLNVVVVVVFFFVYIFSWMNGCERAKFRESRFDGSNANRESSKSRNCDTFRSWSSGKFWSATSSWWRLRVGLMTGITTTFSCCEKMNSTNRTN